ncbi:hypothetical protein PLICRDRAFT_271766 [Plicaturopsis crispa FD-325 SS-3]|nr:hypothetical protein PLICRDRAFT_271766 [Plicaturopsis crispa FD-325 SS-3]
MNNLFQAASDSHSGDDGMLGYCFAPWATDITEWEKDTAGHQDSVSRNLFSVPDSASFDVDSSPFCLLPQPSQGASEDGRSSHQHASHVTPAGAPAAISRTENIPPTPKSEASNSPSNDCTMSTASSSTSSGTGTGKQRRRRFSCILQGCDRQFTSEYTRKVHMTTHQPKVKTSLPCTMPGCQEMFSRQHDRLRHEVSQHGKSCEWSCSVCRRFFSSERMLQIHKCQGQASNSRWTVPATDQKPSNA